MATHRIPLPLETALRLQIAHLEYEKALLQARNQQQTHDMLLREAEHAVQDAERHLLAPFLEGAPIPLSQCTFDREHGCLVYEVPDAPPALPPEQVEGTRSAC